MFATFVAILSALAEMRAELDRIRAS